jgi:hypothetical protein
VGFFHAQPEGLGQFFRPAESIQCVLTGPNLFHHKTLGNQRATSSFVSDKARLPPLLVIGTSAPIKIGFIAGPAKMEMSAVSKTYNIAIASIHYDTP